MDTLRRMNVRQLAEQCLNFLLIISSALMIWKGMAIYANTESPIVVVLSGSMEPAFQRGDLLFLSMGPEPIAVNDVCVFKIHGRDTPIVHRVLRTHTSKKTGQQFLLTKGDNNAVDDRGLYNPGQDWIKPSDVVGRVKGFLPYLGMMTILINDYWWMRYALLGGLLLVTLFTNE